MAEILNTPADKVLLQVAFPMHRVIMGCHSSFIAAQCQLLPKDRCVWVLGSQRCQHHECDEQGQPVQMLLALLCTRASSVKSAGADSRPGLCRLAVL